jgi:YceI-like protein
MRPAKTGPPATTKWVIVKGSGLRVDGSTNINRFNCEIADYCHPDTIVVGQHPAGGNVPVALSGTVSLDVSGFDCHNSIMTAEFRKTVKAAAFPRLSIHFLTLSRLPDPRFPRDVLKGQVSIELAGITREMEINYTACLTGGQLRLTGTRQMKFTDFGLTPPRKLGGMIRTNDVVDIEFHLNIIAIN